MQVANLSADLTANTSRFESGFKRANQVVNSSTSSWARSITQADSKFAAVGGTIGVVVGKFNGLYAAIAAIAAGGALGSIATGSLRAADGLKTLAERLSVSTDTLQAYQYAALQSGLETGTLETALTKLQAKIADGDVHYRNTTEGFEAIAEAVRNAKDDTERARIVNDNFGDKLGAKLLPILSNGVAGLHDFADEAQRTGNIIGGDVIKAAAEFNDRMEALGATIKNNFEAGFLQSLTTQSGDLRDIYTDPNFAEGMQKIGRLHGDLAAYMATVLVNANKLITAYGQLSDTLADYLDKQGKAALTPFADWYDQKITDMTGKPRGNATLAGAGGMPPMPASIPNDPNTGHVPVPGEKPKAPTSATAPYSVPKSSNTGKDANAYQKVLDSLKEQTAEVQLQTKMYGQNESAIQRATQQVKIENDLRSQGINLTAQQKEQLSGYLDTLEDEQYQLEQVTLQHKLLENVTDDLWAAVKRGKVTWDDLRSVALNALGDIIEATIKAQQAQAGVAAGGGSGGFFSDILGSAFGAISQSITGVYAGSGNYNPAKLAPPIKPSVPSHASGIDLVARDSMAHIHQGEAVLNRQDAAMWRSGGDTPMEVHIDARGAEAGVENKIRDVMNQVMLLRKQTPGIALGAVKEANKRDPRFLNV